MIIQKIQSQPKFGMALHITPQITSHNEKNLLKRGLQHEAEENDIYVNKGRKLSFKLWPLEIKFEPVYLVNVVEKSSEGKDKHSSMFVMPKKDASLGSLKSKVSYHSFLAAVKRDSQALDSAFAYFAEMRRAQKIDRFVEKLKKAVLG